MGCRQGAHLPSSGYEPVGGQTTEVCDAWPAQRQTYGYLPSCRASSLFDTLLGDRHVCKQLAQGFHLTAEHSSQLTS